MLFGVGLCGSMALGASLLFRGWILATVVPIAFLSVVAITAKICGRAAGVTGVVVAALVFALFLFQPLHSMAAGDDKKPALLAWMLLFGVVVSCYLSGPRPNRDRKDWPKKSARE